MSLLATREHAFLQLYVFSHHLLCDPQMLVRYLVSNYAMPSIKVVYARLTLSSDNQRPEICQLLQFITFVHV